MCLAFVAAYFVLEAEIKRRKLNLDAYSVVAYVDIAGILGAMLWHVTDPPGDRLPAQILSSRGDLLAWFRGGFAWLGGFVAGIATLLFFARRHRVNWLTMLDLASPAVAVGYAVGRIGCLISGDGDYGKPTNLPWGMARSEEHTSELQSHLNLVCRLLLEKKKNTYSEAALMQSD